MLNETARIPTFNYRWGNDLFTLAIPFDPADPIARQTSQNGFIEAHKSLTEPHCYEEWLDVVNRRFDLYLEMSKNYLERYQYIVSLANGEPITEMFTIPHPQYSVDKVTHYPNKEACLHAKRIVSWCDNHVYYGVGLGVNNAVPLLATVDMLHMEYVLQWLNGKPENAPTGEPVQMEIIRPKGM